MKELIKKIIPSFLLNFYHYCLAIIGAFLYGFPSRKLTVIGITGTSGKTTVVELSSKIFEEAGFKSASLSSLKFKIGNKEWGNKLKMTMPGRFKIQRFLSQANKADCKYVVLEVTSEGIKQHRHKFIDFDVAVFTNLSPEHIESHGSFEKYRGAKLQLFKDCQKVHIINLDDKNSDWFWRIPAQKKIGYQLKTQNSKIKTTVQNLKLLGDFNQYNALAAIHIALSQGISLKVCERALEGIKEIPGRMEVVVEKPFKVIIDYAHTPQSLKKVYETLKNPKSQIPNPKQIQNSNDQNPKLICVLGSCGGGRDKWKRPVLGSLAHKYCREVIVTNEDPYDEDPMEIINQVAQQAPRAKLILDRKKAIKKAISLAHSGDVVVITGKGSEPWMCVAKGKKIPWSDKKIVLDFLKELNRI